jgi:hypothetical protein
MTVTRRTGWLVLGLALLGGVTACGDSTDPQTAPTTSAELTSTAQASSAADATAWAGGVCAAADDLETSLDDLGSSLQVDLGSGQDLSDQIGAQVQEQVDAVADAAGELAAAVVSIPSEADPDVAATAEQLEADREAVQASVDALRAAAGELVDAQDAAALVDGVAGIAAQLALVRLDAATFADSLRTAADQGSSAVRAAFLDAPACDGRF